TPVAPRHGAAGALISMMIALFLITAPFVAARALRILVAGWFAIDLVRNAIAALRQPTQKPRLMTAAAALGNTAVVILLLAARGWLLTWVVTIAGALRIAGVSCNIRVAPIFEAGDAHESVIGDLGLEDEPEAVAMATEIEAAQRARAPIDRGWIGAFVATLFAIHIGRMGSDATLLGLVSPAVAVAGDMLIAVAVTLLLIDPAYLLWR